MRLGYIEEMRRRDPKEWEERLSNFVTKTEKKDELFGNWDDSGLALTQG